MADSQRIHPATEPQSRSTSPPLIRPDSSGLDKGNVMNRRPGLYLETAPAIIHKPPPRTRSCFCRCLCWTVSLVFILVTLIGICAAVIFFVFQPKLPKYSVNSLKISALRLNMDMTLYAQFDVKITANNPNKKIGIYYAKGGLISVWYQSDKLCQGSLPKFYQGHQNVTKLDVVLTGQRASGSTIMSAIQQQQLSGSVPLELKVDTPVSIELGTLKLRKIRILGKCSLVVDSLSANTPISIKASNCKFGSKL